LLAVGLLPVWVWISEILGRVEITKTKVNKIFIAKEGKTAFGSILFAE
jgi:hypothetical protein